LKEVLYFFAGIGLLVLGVMLTPAVSISTAADKSSQEAIVEQAALSSVSAQPRGGSNGQFASLDSEVTEEAAFTNEDYVSPTPPPMLPSASMMPESTHPGGVVLVMLEDEGYTQVVGEWEGRRLHFSQQDGYYWAVMGVPSWMTPGLHRLNIQFEFSGHRQQTVVLPVMVFEKEFPIEDLSPASVRPPTTAAPGSVRAMFPNEQLWRGDFKMPVQGVITSRYGARRAFSQHQGLDIAASYGTDVGAANGGLVVFADNHQAGGNVVVIDHGMGVQTAYFHLSQTSVVVGEWVVRGQTIGEVGSTGYSSGPHVHWEVRIGGLAVDPQEWMQLSPP
jgi:hypothetical protein